jgi:Insertion element 4 transposase N-terminal
VFAPGHLGELTWQVPFDLADAVLEETRRRERRLRDLPSRVGVYFVLAPGLFPVLGYQNPRPMSAAISALTGGRPVRRG